MPRVRNVGELDWNMEYERPVAKPYAMAESRHLCFKLELMDLVESGEIGYEAEISYCRRKWGIDSQERGVQFFPPVVVEFCRRLLAFYPKGVRATIYRESPQVIRFSVATTEYASIIQWPTRFIEALTHKMTKWAKEFDQRQ